MSLDVDEVRLLVFDGAFKEIFVGVAPAIDAVIIVFFESLNTFFGGKAGEVDDALEEAAREGLVVAVEVGESSGQEDGAVKFC